MPSALVWPASIMLRSASTWYVSGLPCAMNCNQAGISAIGSIALRAKNRDMVSPWPLPMKRSLDLTRPAISSEAESSSASRGGD
jgi:hypothetical protein